MARVFDSQIILGSIPMSTAYNLILHNYIIFYIILAYKADSVIYIVHCLVCLYKTTYYALSQLIIVINRKLFNHILWRQLFIKKNENEENAQFDFNVMGIRFRMIS